MDHRNQKTISISDFDGINNYHHVYELGGVIQDSEGVDPNGLEECSNLIFTARGRLVNRPGIVRGTQVDGGGTQRGIKRIFPFTRTTFRFICITHAGRVYDINNGVNTLILTATAGSDLVVQNVGKRIYFAVTPTAGNAGVFVYDPDLAATARAAAGLKPTGTFTVANSATAGSTEPGQHIYAVAFETSTGYITKPSLYVSLTTATRLKIDLNPIPTGPAGTVARHILASRVLRNWDGNLQSPELFFALRIADNVTTSLTAANGLSKFDTELISSAEYLKDLTEEIPTTNALSMYGGRMAFIGGVNDTDTVKMSQPGDYESVLATEGYIKALPYEGGAPKNGAPMQGVFYIFKDARTFATQDNGDSPTRWPVSQVDGARGCSPLGIAKTPGGNYDVEGGLLVLTRDGLYFFDGAYRTLPLTFKDAVDLEPLVFASGVSMSMANWSVGVDTLRKYIYIFTGTGTEISHGYGVEPNNYSTNQVLFGDYSRGLGWQTIRWSAFKFYNWFQCMAISYAANLMPSVVFGQGKDVAATEGWIMGLNTAETCDPTIDLGDLDTANVGRSVPWSLRTGPVGLILDGGRVHLDAVGMRAYSVGLPPTVTVRVYNCDTQAFVAEPNMVMSNTGSEGKTYYSHTNVESERVKLALNGLTDVTVNNTKGIGLLALFFFVSPVDIERPA